MSNFTVWLSGLLIVCSIFPVLFSFFGKIQLENRKVDTFTQFSVTFKYNFFIVPVNYYFFSYNEFLWLKNYNYFRVLHCQFNWNHYKNWKSGKSSKNFICYPSSLNLLWNPLFTYLKNPYLFWWNFFPSCVCNSSSSVILDWSQLI